MRFKRLIFCLCGTGPGNRPDGQAEIDNLTAERTLRNVAIGRRNFLFAGADSGGERATAMYSLFGVDPGAYLHYVIERIADRHANRTDELRPWNVARSMPDAARVASIN